VVDQVSSGKVELLKIQGMIESNDDETKKTVEAMRKSIAEV
jgi:methyl-accepting chemotaxis protein